MQADCIFFRRPAYYLASIVGVSGRPAQSTNDKTGCGWFLTAMIFS